MGWLDRFRRKPETNWVTLRTVEGARAFPELMEVDAVLQTRAESATCTTCGGANGEAVITTGGPFGDPATFRAHPVAIDGRQCTKCGALSFPVALEQEEISALLRAGAAAGQSGRLDEADLAFRRVVNGAPALGLARMNLGSVWLDRAATLPEGPGAKEQRRALAQVAASLFRQALACSLPPPMVTRFLLGRVLTRLGEVEEGHRELRAFLADPSTAEPMRREARQLLDARDWQLDEAQERAYREGAEMVQIGRCVDPRSRLAPQDLVQIRAGVARLDQLLAARPDHWPAWWLSSVATRRLGDWDDAYRRSRAAYELRPDQPDVAREHGAACLGLGYGLEAVAVARRAMASDPADAGLQANLGLAMLVAGNVAGAEEAASAALARATEDKVTQALLRFIRDVAAGRKPRPTQWRD